MDPRRDQCPGPACRQGIGRRINIAYRKTAYPRITTNQKTNKTMKNLKFIALLSLSVSLVSCFDGDTYVGSDTFTTEERIVDNFTGLHISDGTEATVRFGEERSVFIRVNDNLVDRVRTEVRSDVLVVELRNGNYRNTDLSVEITVPDLSFLRASDGAKINAGPFSGLDDLQLEASDGAKITVAGSTESMQVRASDSGKIFAFDVETEDCDAVVSDGAEVEVSVIDALTGRVSDGGRVFYHGAPTISVATSDGGRVVDAN